MLEVWRTGSSCCSWNIAQRKWGKGWMEGILQPFHSQGFCLSKTGFLGSKLKHSFGYMAGLSWSSKLCCSSRHCARQKWFIELARKSPDMYTHRNWDPSWSFCAMQSLQETGRAEKASRNCFDLHRVFPLETSGRDRRLHFQPKGPWPWRRCVSLKAQLGCTKASSDNKAAAAWRAALNAPWACIAQQLWESCWEVLDNPHVQRQDVSGVVPFECLLLSQNIDVSHRTALCSEVPINMRLPIPRPSLHSNLPVCSL